MFLMYFEYKWPIILSLQKLESNPIVAIRSLEQHLKILDKPAQEYIIHLWAIKEICTTEINVPMGHRNWTNGKYCQ